MGRVEIILYGEAAPVTYTDEAIALFAEMDVEPDDTRKGLINDFFVSVIDGGVLPLLDTLYFTAAHDDQAGRLNWKSPTLYELVKVNAPTFTTDRGFTGDGATKYLDTNFNTLTNSVQFTQDNAVSFVYVNQVVNEYKVAAGSFGGGGFNYIVPMDSSAASFSINAALEVTRASTGLGLLATDRTSNVAMDVYINGAISAGTTAIASTALPNSDDFILGLSSSGVLFFPSQSRVAVRGLGAALDATKHTVLYNAIQTYLTAIGAQA